MLSEFLKEADLVCAIGSSLTRTPFGPGIPAGKKIIHSTNNPDDINKDYRTDQALLGDAQLVINALITEIKTKKVKSSSTKLSQLTQQILTKKKAWLDEWNIQAISDEIPINQYRIIHDLMNNIDRANTIITHDSGSPREQLLPFWETTVPGSYIGWGKSTQLGYGLGLTIGAKLAEPEKLCINIMGDAAIGMTGMDLETAARYGIGTLTIVFNNGVMAAERDVLIEAESKYGALTVGGNYRLFAQSLGVNAARVEKPSDFINVLKNAVKTTEEGKPYLIECLVKEGHEFSRDNLKDL